MEYKGSFRDRHERRVTVEIVTGGQAVPSREIGTEESGVWFSEEAVEIRSEVNDTFDHVLRHSATIRLLAREWPGELFEGGSLGVTVRVTREGECLFAGYLEPQAYSQGYNEELDEVELSCIDCLSALQYRRYGGVGTAGVIYEAVKAGAEIRGAYDIVRECLSHAGVVGDAPLCLYDGSRRRTSSETSRSIFRDIGVSELLFLGGTEDDVWTQGEVLEEIMRYLNLHIVQDGERFRVFAWESLKGGGTVEWQDLGGLGMPNRIIGRTGGDPIGIRTGMATDCDTQISVADVYSQMALTCDIEGVGKVVENPLEASELTSPYTNKQLYMTEYSAKNSKEGYNDFWEIIHGYAATRDAEAKIRDWYVRVKQHPRWRFPARARYSDKDTVDEYCTGQPQHVLPDALHPAGSIQGAIVSMGSVERNADGKDNSPAATVDMSDCLVIGINGNEATKYPTGDFVLGCVPLAVYEGASSGAALSPCDGDTVNYIVFSGNILLNPHVDRSDTYNNLRTKGTAGTGHWDDYPNWPNVKRCGEWKNDGSDPKYRYYATQYWEAATPTAAPTWDTGPKEGLMPPVGDGLKRFQYEPVGGKDVVSKVPVLRCMLVVGDKCVKETGTSGKPSDFEWVDYKPREECKDFDEWLLQSFTLGFDPKIGDYLIGTEYAIQNNIDISMGLDAEGTAIPVRFSDHIGGAVRFQILCPVNMSAGADMLGIDTPKWIFGFPRSPQLPILPKLDNIILKGFEAKVYSDNGGVSLLQDNDVVYMTDAKEGWAGRKDDITFRINSALTREERQRMGVSDTVKMSAAVDGLTGLPLTSVYDAIGRRQVKPEELYLDSYYREYSVPRIVMEQSLDDREGNVDPWRLYQPAAMRGRQFFVTGVSRDLRDATARVTMKETNA